MELKPWMQSITPNDMPNDDLRFIAEKAGMQSALALLFCTPGLTVSIPKNPFKIIKEEYIKNNYDGTKYMLNKLAVECGCSQRYIYKILQKYAEARETKQ